MDHIPVKITDAALSNIQQIIDKKQVPQNYYVRFAIKGGACGANFIVGFDQPNHTHDLFFAYQGLTFLIDKRHLMYLLDVTVDYQVLDDSQGFVFSK